jgi:ADP-ribose pyrophosphatase YjhB (NUDIX family)
MNPRNPLLTVDIIIECRDGIVLIERKNPPHGWALPGGFVDYGESIEAAAIREAKEETGLTVELIEQMHTYSDPQRDPRHHTVSTVFIARAHGRPVAADDARCAAIVTRNNLPSPIVFDHTAILDDYFRYSQSDFNRKLFRYSGTGGQHR